MPSSHIFSPHQRGQILISDLGILIWLGGMVWSSYTWGFLTMFRVYLMPYLWVSDDHYAREIPTNVSS